MPLVAPLVSIRGLSIVPGVWQETSPCLGNRTAQEGTAHAADNSPRDG